MVRSDLTRSSTTGSVPGGSDRSALNLRIGWDATATIWETQKSLEQAWDGDWYRRAYFDDGTPLSAQNDECRIDSIAVRPGR